MESPNRALPLILVGTLLLGAWCTARLMMGKPRWNSLFGIGRDHHRGYMEYPGIPAGPYPGERFRHLRRPSPRPSVAPPFQTGPASGPQSGRERP